MSNGFVSKPLFNRRSRTIREKIAWDIDYSPPEEEDYTPREDADVSLPTFCLDGVGFGGGVTQQE